MRERWRDPDFRKALAVPVYLLVLAWVNIYICREMFFTEYTGHMSSMHGFWIAMARLASTHWLQPTWWPFWDAGMPFEFTYAPLVPAVTAACAKLTGCSAALAYLAVSGFFYCFGPLTLFLMAWKISGFSDRVARPRQPFQTGIALGGAPPVPGCRLG